MATLRELAERTGYSAATISRILSGDPALSVSMEARRKVLEEAGRLNYTATRSRRGRAPKGVLRVGIAEMLTPAQQLEDPFYLYLSGFVRQGCLDRKYTAVPLESRGEGFLPPEGEPLDGMIAIGKFRPGQIEAMEALCPQIVFLNSSPLESRFDSVVLNFSLGISMALEHLAELGHRSVGFIGPEWKLDDLGRFFLSSWRPGGWSAGTGCWTAPWRQKRRLERWESVCPMEGLAPRLCWRPTRRRPSGPSGP